MADYCSSPDTLVLSISGGPSLDLLSDQQGFRVEALDLGYPAVREVVGDNPDRSGQYDLTKLFGARPVTITGFLVPSPAGSRQLGWHALAPFLDPAARVTLTYRVDPDAVVKTMTVRAAQATATFDNPTVSPAQVGFKAPDPMAYDATVQTAYCWAGSGGVTTGGRVYPLTFNRVYPPGGYAYVTTYNGGDQNAYPVLRIYGPITGPVVQTNIYKGDGSQFPLLVAFQTGYVIGTGYYVQVDCKAHTAYLNGDPTRSVYNQLSFGTNSGWPWTPPQPGYTTWALNGSGYSASTQLMIQWQNPYLL
jgi:hypothetical protein